MEKKKHYYVPYLNKDKTERNEQQRFYSIKKKNEEKVYLKTLFHDWNVPERGWIQTKLVIIFYLIRKLRLSL